MAARFTHGSATPAVIDIILREFDMEPVAPTRTHYTDYGNRIGTYVLGKYTRRASLEVMVTTKAEYDAFLSFFRTATNANTRFTFVADAINNPSDTWSAFFMGEPKFSRDPNVPGSNSRHTGTFSFDIEDATVNL
jgi:hypothetical protein